MIFYRALRSRALAHPHVAGSESSRRQEATTAGIVKQPYWRIGKRQLDLFEPVVPLSRWMWRKKMKDKKQGPLC